MYRTLALSLAILCWVSSSSAQTCGGCSTSCSGNQCCLWDDPAVDENPESLVSGYPLGYTTRFMPRVESDDPKPCMVVNIPEPSRRTYIQVAIESDTDICVYAEGKENVKSCVMADYFCDTDGYTGVSSVTFNFDCTSCPAADAPFYFRVTLEALDNFDEHWCEDTSANSSFPSSIIQSMNTAFPPSDISQPTVPVGSASHFLVTPALLVISVIIVALSTL